MSDLVYIINVFIHKEKQGFEKNLKAFTLLLSRCVTSDLRKTLCIELMQHNTENDIFKLANRCLQTAASVH